MHKEFDTDVSRTALLSGISLKTLGSTANLFLSILVSLACFTTAVGIVTGTADFVKSQFKNSRTAYIITAVIGCLLGVLMGQFNVHYIIAVAVPALMFIYPITIILILLNVVPDKYASKQVFRAVVITTILFSIPDFLGSIGSPFLLLSTLFFLSSEIILNYFAEGFHHVEMWISLVVIGISFLFITFLISCVIFVIKYKRRLK